jgi:hypothetical protein
MALYVYLSTIESTGVLPDDQYFQDHFKPVLEIEVLELFTVEEG